MRDKVQREIRHVKPEDTLLEDAQPVKQAADDLYAAAMNEFEGELERSLAEQGHYLSEADKMMYRKGKGLRPRLLLLFALLCRNQEYAGSERIPSKIVSAAVSLEMLHVATLIHDDIIDAASYRRSYETINARQGTEMAILIGDMQFVQAIRKFTHMIENEHDLQLVQQVLDTGMELCKGEIDELLVDADIRDPTLQEQRYMRTIDRKTARLISMSCRAGAALADGSKRACWYAGQFGQKLGQAFQIMDDLKDLTQDLHESGKQRGIDLARRRFTLPYIYAMEELEEGHIVQRMLLDSSWEPSAAELEEARIAVLQSSGMTKAYSKAHLLLMDALDLLELFPASPYRSELEWIARRIMN